MSESKALKEKETTKDTAKDTEARDRLLEVAGKLFAAKGLDGVSTRDLAKESGLNISLISYYFGGKEGLYKAVLFDFATHAQNQLGHILNDFSEHKMTSESFVNDMRSIVQGMVKTKFDYPYIMELLQREVLSGLPFARDIYDTIFRALAERIVGIIQVAQKKKIMNPNLHPYILFLSLVHAQDMYFAANKCSAGILNKCYRLPEQADEYTDQLLKIFIEGHLL